MQTAQRKAQQFAGEIVDKAIGVLQTQEHSLRLEVGEWAVGDTVLMGKYEQGNGIKPIEWRVLDRVGHKVLLLSEYGIDCKPFDTIKTNVTWETCSLRTWLNITFKNTAFDSDEKELILSTTVTADKNPTYDTSPGENTTDKVFLLSITEVNKYFKSDSARQCKGTAYCYERGAYKGNNGNCLWWLRSPGYSSSNAARVINGGSVDDYGDSVYRSQNAVRPALWINLEP